MSFTDRTHYFCFMIIAVKIDNEIKYGNIRKISDLIGVHHNTISRWIKSDDRVVIKNGYEIFLKVKKL